MKNIKRTLGKTIFALFTILIYSCNDDEAPLSPCESDVFFADICISYNIDDLTIVPDGTEVALTDNQDFRIEFEFQAEAELALEIIQFYSLNEYCKISQNSSFSYFLTDGEIPEGSFDGEDCLDQNVCNLEVKLTTSGFYTVIEPTLNGERWLYSSTSEENTNKILSTIQYFQSNFGCYVGRPVTEMHYLRK